MMRHALARLLVLAMLACSYDASAFQAGFVGRMGPPVSADQATYDIGFVGMASLPSNITFTRASDAGYFNASCVWTIAGNNQPRFDHQWNASTSLCEPRGLLIEGQRTNLLLRSQSVVGTSPWNFQNATGSNNVVMSPDGTTNASQLNWTSGATWGGTRQNVNLNNNTAYTLSAFFKAGSLGIVRVNVFDGSSDKYVIYNLADQSLVSSKNATGTITSVGNGWFRITCTVTTGSNASASQAQFRFHVGTGTNGDYWFVWGAQLEAGTFASSYIPTTTAAATRAADIAGIPSLPTIGFNPNEGTLVVEYSAYGKIATGFYNKRFANFTDGSLNNRFGVSTTQEESNTQIYVGVGGVSKANVVGEPFAVDTVYKTALAYKVGDLAFSTNGSTISTASPSELPSVDRLSLGHINGSGQPFGHIRRLTYYPVRLPDSQLQALTQ